MTSRILLLLDIRNDEHYPVATRYFDSVDLDDEK
jgi:hypothetical protein